MKRERRAAHEGREGEDGLDPGDPSLPAYEAEDDLACAKAEPNLVVGLRVGKTSSSPAALPHRRTRRPQGSPPSRAGFMARIAT